MGSSSFPFKKIFPKSLESVANSCRGDNRKRSLVQPCDFTSEILDAANRTGLVNVCAAVN